MTAWRSSGDIGEAEIPSREGGYATFGTQLQRVLRTATFDASLCSYPSMPFRRLLLITTVLASLTPAAASTSTAQAQCPGGSPACPYTAQSEIGQRAGGTLRFPQSVAVGPDGTVFVGDQGSHTVQAFNPDGTFKREYGSAGTRPHELSAVGALAVAGDGSLLVADGSNKIVRFAPSGEVIATWGRTGSAVGQFRFGGGRGNDAGAGGGIAVGGNHVYVADSGNNRIQRFNLTGGNGAEIVPPGTLGYPKGVSVRKSRLYVADNQNHRVLVMDTGGRLLGTIKTDKAVGGGNLSHPYGVSADPQGRVFVSDNMNHRVVRFSSPATNYKFKGRWGSYGTAPGTLAYPRALTTDGAGNVYVTNTGNDRVDVYDRGGTLLRSIGTSGRANGQFNTPMGVAADPAGIRAVADSVNGRIELFNPDGSVAAVWGTPNPGPTILQRPIASVFDGAGNAYVLDQRRGRIFVFSRQTGKPIRQIAAPGSGPGKLSSPSAIAMDNQGRMYVADTGNRRIAKFANDGSYLGAITETGDVRGIAVTPEGARVYAAAGNNRITVWDGQSGDELDWFGGTGSKLGKLNSPGQMTLDGAGNLWVADRGNSRVQQFGPNGERIQTFGARGTGPGQFLRPTGVSVDCRGVLTVSDTDNNRVQSFQLATPAPATCAELGPVATPPPPRYPTLPPPDGPSVTVKPLRATGVLSSRNIPFRLGCDAKCSITATAKVAPRATPKKGNKPVAIELKATTEIPAGESKIVRFKLTAKQVATLRKALGKKSKGLFADLTITGTAAAGAPTTVAQRLQLTG
jgi:sugar lactone lactonase YvrE